MNRYCSCSRNNQTLIWSINTCYFVQNSWLIVEIKTFLWMSVCPWKTVSVDFRDCYTTITLWYTLCIFAKFFYMFSQRLQGVWIKSNEILAPSYFTINKKVFTNFDFKLKPINKGRRKVCLISQQIFQKQLWVSISKSE